MAFRSKKDPGNANSVAINTFSRVISVVMLTLLFGVGGHYLDKWFETNFWTVVGFVLGGCLTLVGLLYVVKAAEFDRKSQKIQEGGSPPEAGTHEHEKVESPRDAN